jgi:pimeloyl-ACP methyl ester carboxylesterase
MRIVTAVVVLMMGFFVLSARGAESPASAPATQPVYHRPLGIAMEEWPYPFTVNLMQMEIQGQRMRMAYMDVAPTANANGRTVVLFHGKNFFGGYWENTIRALTSAGYRVVVPDQIGFGKSSKPDIHYGFDLLAANTATMLDQLKIKDVAVVGHSMGGMLAVRFARNYAARTTHLILENPIGLEDYRMKVPPRALEEAYRDELSKSPEQIRGYLKTYFPTWKPEYEKFVEVPARISLSGEFPRYARASALTYLMIYQQPVRHEFPLIKPPTLLVIGQEDRTTLGRGQVPPDVLKTLGNYPALGKAAAKEIPNAKLIELPGVGHIPHLESPEAFHKSLVEFLR